MREQVSGHNDGLATGSATAACARDLRLLVLDARPVFEPEVARAAQRGWWRRLARRDGAGQVARVAEAYGENALYRPGAGYGLVCADEAAAAELAAEKIAAARLQLRIAAADARIASGADGWRLMPEHVAIVATLMLTLGNAAWHYLA